MPAGKPKGYPKAGGRQKGVPNKKTEAVRTRIKWVLSLLEPTLKEDIAKLSPTDRVRTWVVLQEYEHPKLQRQTIVDDEGKSVSIVKLYLPDNKRDNQK